MSQKEIDFFISWLGASVLLGSIGLPPFVSLIGGAALAFGVTLAKHREQQRRKIEAMRDAGYDI